MKTKIKTETMKDLTKHYIDLSKCSEEQRKKIAKTLSDNNQPCYQGLLNCLNNGDYNKTFYLLSFFKRRDLWDFAHEGLESTENKSELTYPEFIKLFEGREGEISDLEKLRSWFRVNGEMSEDGLIITYSCKEIEEVFANYINSK